MSRSSITSEIEAVGARMETSPDGLVAFRQGGIEGSKVAKLHAHMKEIGILERSTELIEDVQGTLDRTGSDLTEIAKRNNPDEFILGATMHAYQVRRGQT